MGHSTDYREIVKRVILQYADYVPPVDKEQTELVFDEERGHYEMLFVGWEGARRIHGCVLHLDIKNGKIWIQHDGTEDGIATDLEEAGVPKEHIVLAFHPPYKRPYTGFAVA